VRGSRGVHCIEPRIGDTSVAEYSAIDAVCVPRNCSWAPVRYSPSTMKSAVCQKFFFFSSGMGGLVLLHQIGREGVAFSPSSPYEAALFSPSSAMV